MHGFAYNPLKGFYTKPANGWTRDIEQKTFELPFLKPLLLTVHQRRRHHAVVRPAEFGHSMTEIRRNHRSRLGD